MEESEFLDEVCYEWSSFYRGQDVRERSWERRGKEGGEEIRKTPGKMINSLQGIFCKGRHRSWTIYAGKPWHKKDKGKNPRQGWGLTGVSVERDENYIQPLEKMSAGSAESPASTDGLDDLIIHFDSDEGVENPAPVVTQQAPATARTELYNTLKNITLTRQSAPHVTPAMRDAATTLNNRGVAYDKAGEYDREIANYDEAIRMNPDYVTAFCNRGKAYIEKGQYDHAIADFDEAIRLNPNFALAFNNRGVVYQAKGKKEKSRAGFMQKTFGTPGQEYFEKAKVDFAKARQLGYKG